MDAVGFLLPEHLGSVLPKTGVICQEKLLTTCNTSFLPISPASLCLLAFCLSVSLQLERGAG